MPRRSRSRSPRRRREESRSPILRRRSYHDRPSVQDRGRERGRRRRSSHETPVRRSHGDGDWNMPRDRRQRDVEHARSEDSRNTWQNDVHPSRLTDVTLDTTVEDNSKIRTDRFASERFEQTSDGFAKLSGGTRARVEERGRRREGRDWRRGEGRDKRRSVGDARIGEAVREGLMERGRGRGGGHFDGAAERMDETHQEMERRGRGRGGRRGVVNRENEQQEREQMEKEDRVYREKRLLDSLTDPRDVPKGTWYFEHDDREVVQTTQPTRRYSTGDDSFRRDRSQRDGGRDREKARAGWLDLPRDGERERGRQQRSPQVWRHDMFEKLQREDEREGEGEGEEGSEEEEEDLKDSRKRRSVVHQPGTTTDRARSDHHRDASIDGTWSHDKFSEHDQLVSYPIHTQPRERGRREERGRGEERGRREERGRDKERTQERGRGEEHAAMDTM